MEFQLPILLWWTPFSTTQGIKTCSDTLKSYDCYFTHDRTHRLHPKTSAIFFYGTQFSPTDLPLPRYEHEDWALIHEESPKNNPLISQSSIISLFNHTATFRSESDLPLTFQYLESLDVITDEVCILTLKMSTLFLKHILEKTILIKIYSSVWNRRSAWNGGSQFSHQNCDSFLHQSK